MINLGDTVEDTITGFQGVALAKMVALHEATQFRVHPKQLKNADGEMAGNVWIEETRLTLVEQSKVIGFAPQVGR